MICACEVLFHRRRQFCPARLIAFAAIRPSRLLYAPRQGEIKGPRTATQNQNRPLPRLKRILQSTPPTLSKAPAAGAMTEPRAVNGVKFPSCYSQCSSELPTAPTTFGRGAPCQCRPIRSPLMSNAAPWASTASNKSPRSREDYGQPDDQAARRRTDCHVQAIERRGH